MKKLLVAAAALVWAGAAFAANPGGQHHSPASLSCSECHTMHASRTHRYDGSAPQTNDARYNTPGYNRLLVADGTNATCLACHDAPFGDNTDVFKTVTGQYLNARSGGALNGTVTGHEDNTTYQDYMGHTLGSALVPPGWDSVANGAYTAGTEGFNCSHCHAVHGGAPDAFRNLGGTQWMGPGAYGGKVFSSPTNPFITNYPTFAADIAAGLVNTAVDVTYSPKAYAAGGSKDARNVAYGVGSGNVNGPNGMNRYCGNCHGKFHGSSNTDGTGGAFIRHPTSGTDVLARMTTIGAQFNVTRPVYTADDKSAGEVGCLTCHKAHGNKRAFGLIWPANGTAESATTNFEDGDGTKYQSLCKTCHGQASAF